MSPQDFELRIEKCGGDSIRVMPLSPSESSGAFESGFLIRVSERDPVATAQFAAHVRTVVWIWLKKNHPERAKWPGEVERLVELACQRMVQEASEWTVPGNLGRCLRGLCVDSAMKAKSGSGEAAVGAPAQGDRHDWLNGGYQDPVRRLLDELPARDRELLIGVFRQGNRPQPESSDGAYLRLLLFRARLRFRDLTMAAATAGSAPPPPA